MPGSITKSKTAQRVAELLGAREGREHLNQYGWVQGLPIVMATTAEKLIDVMGLVSIHERAVLIALASAENHQVQLMHVSMPNAVLRVVAAADEEAMIESLFDLVARQEMTEFRVKYWAHSAVAQRIPPFVPQTHQPACSYANYLGT